MLIMLISLLLASAILLYFYQRNKNSSTSNHAHPTRTPLSQQQRLQAIISSGKYWGIKISPLNKSACCSAVSALQNKQFPINSVPSLPLQNCTQDNCHCKHSGLPEKRKPGSQRRQHNDRRESVRFEDISDRRSHSDRRSGIWTNHE